MMIPSNLCYMPSPIEFSGPKTLPVFKPGPTIPQSSKKIDTPALLYNLKFFTSTIQNISIPQTLIEFIDLKSMVFKWIDCLLCNTKRSSLTDDSGSHNAGTLSKDCQPMGHQWAQGHQCSVVLSFGQY